MNCLVVVDTSCSGCCCWLINNAFCSWIKKVVVVVVLVLDNNNKNAEADPSTLFCRLSFNSLKMWHNGDGLLYYCGPRWVATSTVTSLAARSCPTMIPHVKTAVVGIWSSLSGWIAVLLLVLCGSSWYTDFCCWAVAPWWKIEETILSQHSVLFRNPLTTMTTPRS